MVAGSNGVPGSEMNPLTLCPDPVAVSVSCVVGLNLGGGAPGGVGLTTASTGANCSATMSDTTTNARHSLTTRRATTLNTIC